MSDLSEKLAAIPEAAVVAVANELHDREGYMTSLADSPDHRKAYYMEIAQAALEAANLPLLALVREQAAKLAVVDEALERALKFHKEIESYGGYCTGCARVGPCEVREALEGEG